ncbi:MAG: DUF3179 domain-containing protein [Candidatus Eisenbacteria bacterium]|uniref:DUF3179 domain-containing protein n=1 Tax=Eiseniibacteriota bacterium TaxID=2212470 RepID=A0A7Y2H386_UNCEI|nr:DUF3179 domain-containing protein [Candidatus Eisenbacteria bacterium]
MKKQSLWLTVLSVAVLPWAMSCSESETTTGPTTELEVPDDGDLPEDPGLSFDLACLTTLPIENPLANGGYDPTAIPAVSDPEFLPPSQIDFMGPTDRVFGVEIEGVFLAFPTKILNYHEICNFQVGDTRSAATW